MKTRPIDDYYAREADRIARGPQLYGGDARMASLRCFQRYHKERHVDITDGDGMIRWMSRKQARIYAVIARVSMSPTGTTRMIDVALEVGCTTSTVSRTIRKLEAWSMFAVEIRRGRTGGITVHRKGWDRFYDYVREARAKLRHARVKLASVFQRGNETSPSTSTVMDASFSRPRSLTFAQSVRYERAMLALDDPDGEYDAVRPLINRDDIDNALLLAEDERRRQDKEIREAALQGDWERWELLRKDRWEE